MNHDQLAEAAMIAEEKESEPGTTLFNAGDTASALYLLREGNVELHFTITDERGMEQPQDYLVGMINPGEVLGISALIRPYLYTTNAVTAVYSLLIKLDGVAVRALCERDIELAAEWHRQIAEVTMDRLNSTRIQLLAAA